MTKIYLDSESLKNNVNVPLQNASAKFSSAYEISNTFSVPTGFKFATYVKELASTIKGFKTATNDMETWINKSIASYASMRDKLDKNCKNIESNIIRERITIIK